MHIVSVPSFYFLQRYAVLNYLNETEHKRSRGNLFEHLVDEAAQITYAQRLWRFFRGLLKISFSKIFELFNIEEEYQSYFSILDQIMSMVKRDG